MIGASLTGAVDWGTTLDRVLCLSIAITFFLCKWLRAWPDERAKIMCLVLNNCNRWKERGGGGGGIEITHSQGSLFVGEVGWYLGIKGYHGNHWLLCYVPTLNPKPTSSRAALVGVCTSPPVVQVQVARGRGYLPPRRVDETEHALPSDTHSQSWSKCGSMCGPPRLAAAALPLTVWSPDEIRIGPYSEGGFLIQLVDYSRAGKPPCVPKIQRLTHIFINQIIYSSFRGLSP